ncbi:hypothetical protein E2C01_061921 [Portunus trituberculatus]|uniref:Uncharacterized protein n=1 Tax=Portunus trituberculatus TaxID=210409 RepID=A0A5B7HFP8_PORTR|nr:hypothetical protein [Portunus trituberculatus]
MISRFEETRIDDLAGVSIARAAVQAEKKSRRTERRVFEAVVEGSVCGKKGLCQWVVCIRGAGAEVGVEGRRRESG